MLKTVTQLQTMAESISNAAERAGVDAHAAVAEIQTFREWAESARAELQTRHGAVKDALDEHQGHVNSQLTGIIDRATAIINKLKGDLPEDPKVVLSVFEGRDNGQH